jgi:hypothetical protein
MDNGEKGALPYGFSKPSGEVERQLGMTKLEYFSAIAMQGVISNARDFNLVLPSEVASVSVSMARALLNELKKYE